MEHMLAEEGKWGSQMENIEVTKDVGRTAKFPQEKLAHRILVMGQKVAERTIGRCTNNNLNLRQQKRVLEQVGGMESLEGRRKGEYWQDRKGEGEERGSEGCGPQGTWRCSLW